MAICSGERPRRRPSRIASSLDDRQLRLVYAAPRRRELLVRGALRHAGVVAHPGPHRAGAYARGPAPVAAPRPALQALTRPGEVRRRGLARERPRRRDEPVPRDLVGHRRRRAPQLGGHLAAAPRPVEHPRDGLALVPREPGVGPLRRPLPLLPRHPASSVPRAGLSGPRGEGFPDSSIRVSLDPEAVAMNLQI